MRNNKSYLVRYMPLVLTIGIIALTVGCRSLTHNLQKSDPDNNRLGIAFGDGRTMESSTDTMYRPQMPDFLEITDDEGNTLIAVERDLSKDEDIIGEYRLQGIEVRATRKGIVERNGKIDLDFIITVPKPLIDRKWQLRVYPIAIKDNGDELEFQPVLLSGADFLRRQKAGYEEYQRFIASIIPDSLYWQEMLDHKGYNKAMSDLEAEYHAAWQKQLLLHDKWIDWENKLNKRYTLFNSKMERNKASVSSDDWRNVLPAFWLHRGLEKDMIPKSFAEFAFSDDAIVKQTVTPEDSVRILEKYWNYQRMAENERKREEKEAMRDKLIKFPHIAAKLDTIVEGKDDWHYFYRQELATDRHMKKIELYLTGEVVAIDQSRYDVPGSDTLVYNVSAMVDFIDEAPRYMLEVVYRQVDKNERVYIEFPVAKSVVDPDFGNNREELSKISAMARDIEYTGELVLDSVTMVAYSSPEGGAAYNKQLSQRRANGLKDYLVRVNMFEDFSPRSIKATAEGENWGMFSEWVANNLSPQEGRDEILGLVNDIADLDKREHKIRSSFPSTYARIKEEGYPSLRCVDFRLHTHRKDMVQDTVHTTVVDERYNAGRDLLRERDYRAALAVLQDYPRDYNTAICYMSLGYDKEALHILENNTNKESSDVQYLLAILYYRNGRVEDALKALIKSSEGDRKKVYRAQLDPELNAMIEQYGLFKDVLEF